MGFRLSAFVFETTAPPKKTIIELISVRGKHRIRIRIRIRI